MSEPPIWVEVIMMPSSPQRNPIALVGVADGNLETRSAVVTDLDIEVLTMQINGKYGKFADCPRNDAHDCIHIDPPTNGVHEDDTSWVRLMLTYERACFSDPRHLVDLFHDVANWLNRARSLGRASI